MTDRWHTLTVRFKTDGDLPTHLDPGQVVAIGQALRPVLAPQGTLWIDEIALLPWMPQPSNEGHPDDCACVLCRLGPQPISRRWHTHAQPEEPRP